MGAWASDLFNFKTKRYIRFLVLIAILATFFLFIRSSTWAIYSSKISYKLYKKLIKNIFVKKKEFFDTTPIG